MNGKAKILVVDDHPSNVKALSKRLTAEGHQVLEATSGSEAIKVVETGAPDLVLLDVMMPGMDGYEACRIIKENTAKRFTPVIMITAKTETEDIVRGLENGADEYVTKPFEPVELMARINSMLRIRSMYEENAYLKKELSSRYDASQVIGRSPAIRKSLDLVTKIANESVTILLSGETGTGKETFARCIHFSGNRKSEKFVAINCGAIPENLLESELFGHKKGSFTGATDNRIGLFEAAENGTIFLDEIGETSPNMQVRLLRVLQEREFSRVGETTLRQTNARVIAASNRDLEELVKDGQFRQDLYFRLSVFPIHLPALRERSEDIPLLATHFLETFCAKSGRKVPVFADEAIAALQAHTWPGNIRELRNEVERALILSPGSDEIDASALSDKIGQAPQFTMEKAANGSLKELIASVEMQAIQASNVKHKGNKTHMSKQLGISRWTLLKKMEAHGIE